MSHLRGYIWSLFFLSIFAHRAAAESAYNYIASQSPISFSQGGAALIPSGVLQPIANGQISPIMQFVLVNSMMTKCIKNAAKDVPARREAFVSANAKFTNGYCKIRKCFEQGMLMGMLSQLSSNPNYGGSSDESERNGSQMMGLVLAQSFQKENGCGGASDSGINPALLQAIK